MQILLSQAHLEQRVQRLSSNGIDVIDVFGVLRRDVLGRQPAFGGGLVD